MKNGKILIFIFFFNFLKLYPSIVEEDREILKLKKEIETIELKIEKLQNKKEKNKLLNGKRKKIGLVLSGGGAKGFAHIGVLKALEKNGIEIDYITGTSMGAIIATLYSIGYTPDEIEELSYNLDLKEILSGENDRSKAPLETRLKKNKSIATLRYDKSLNFSLPKGLTDNNASYLKLKELLKGYDSEQDFDKLPIPLRIIATDLNTGEGVAFKSGDLARVLNASIAIPTLTDPVRIGETPYIDGMIARNFPVEDILDMGAEVIIGSDVTAVLKEEDKYDIVTVFNKLLGIYSSKGNKEQREMATFVIAPELNEVSSTDFSQIKKIISAGENATLEQIEKIKSVNIIKKVSEKDKQKKLKIKNANLEKISIEQIQFKNENLSVELRETIKELFKDYKNKELIKEDFDKFFQRINNLDYIEKVYYTFSENRKFLILDIDEKPANTLGMGVNYRSDYGTIFNVNTNILKFGKTGSLTNAGLNFGDYFGAEISNFSYYGLSNKIGIISALSYNEHPFILYQKGKKLAKYTEKELSLKFGISSQIRDQILLVYGLNIHKTELELETGSKNMERYNDKTIFGDGFFKLAYDNLNDSMFPTKGGKLDLHYIWGGAVFSYEKPVNFYGPIYSGKQNFYLTEKISMFSEVSGGAISGDSVPLNKYIKLGGFYNNLKKTELAFSGYHFQEKMTSGAIIFQTGIQYKILDNFYFTGKYNLGSFSEKGIDESSINRQLWKDFVNGYEFSLGYKTIFGPINLSISKNDDMKEWLYQLNIGYYLE
ncbi:MAG: patatin-like phospholipase family protein [Fusobacteriaceae bacterium]